jgi:inosose dehydratase
VRHGLYLPLGRGDVDLVTIVSTLEQAGYEGWYVLEQDTILESAPTSGGPADAVRASLEHLRSIAGVG